MKRTIESHVNHLLHVYEYKLIADMILKGKVILEVGSGEGYGTEILSINAEKVIALEIDEKLVQDASRKYASNSIAFQLYDGKQFPFPDEFFDVVVSVHVLEHVESDENFIHEVCRVLRNDGQAFFITPNKSTRLESDQKPWNIDHLREYTPEDLLKSLNSSFKKVTIQGVDAVDDIRLIELNRVKKYKLLNRIDFLNIKNILPKNMTESIGSLLLRIMNYFSEYGYDPKSINEDGLEKIFFITNNLLNSLHLIGICKKI